MPWYTIAFRVVHDASSRRQWLSVDSGATIRNGPRTGGAHQPPLHTMQACRDCKVKKPVQATTTENKHAQSCDVMVWGGAAGGQDVQERRTLSGLAQAHLIRKDHIAALQHIT